MEFEYDYDPKATNTERPKIPEGNHPVEIVKIEDKTKFGKFRVTFKLLNNPQNYEYNGTIINTYGLKSEGGKRALAALIYAATKADGATKVRGSDLQVGQKVMIKTNYRTLDDGRQFLNVSWVEPYDGDEPEDEDFNLFD